MEVEEFPFLFRVLGRLTTAKIFVNPKSLRDGDEFRELLQLPRPRSQSVSPQIQAGLLI